MSIAIPSVSVPCFALLAQPLTNQIVGSRRECNLQSRQEQLGGGATARVLCRCGSLVFAVSSAAISFEFRSSTRRAGASFVLADRLSADRLTDLLSAEALLPLIKGQVQRWRLWREEWLASRRAFRQVRTNELASEAWLAGGAGAGRNSIKFVEDRVDKKREG